MKKFLLIAVAASVLSTPAMAADWQGKTYGQDAMGLYDLNANVDTFCKFGTSSTGQNVSNAVVTPGAPGSAAEGDGTFTLDIQNDNDNTVQGALGRYKVAYAVCNTSHELTVQSQNGGLRNNATTSDTAFLSLVPYNVGMLFDGNGATTSSTNATSEFKLSTIREARAGEAEVGIEVPAQDKLLIQGRYSDRLVAAIRPFI
ncbi:hypothetical protein [Sphingomonas sp. LY160]|uniref:hypothetical protein n=1 Tax=Sphingomonas sp. LY160 TaxID=3095342 RepID=UPI002ADEF776|nr:hypothetical protein [Sphingomonas sp. LY160]MEA1072967.1 hypothetical protein [Sphingomonas sp. LY160]